LGAVRLVGGRNKDIVAILVEPIIGEGGITIPSAGYLKGLRKICDEHGWLLMIDEIQSGMCRTGKWFACQHEAVLPDVMTLAKGLGNGVPIGACLARGKAAQVFKPGSHGSTFSGNPLVCRVALAVIDLLEKGKLADRAAKLGQRLLGKLKETLGRFAGVRDIRGCGLMLAIELDRPCKDILTLALARGILINVTAENIIRLLPPLIFTDDEADLLVTELTACVREFLGIK
jgi:acetylornithine aminotransferase